MLEDLLLECAALVDGEEITILAVSIDDAVSINSRRIDAPFERVGMVRNACYRPVWIASAALRVGVLELPLDREVRTKLRYEKFLRTRRVRGGPICRTERRDVAVRPKAAVVVVLDDDGVGGVVRIDRNRAVPAKVVRAQVGAIRGEVHQMSLCVVVPCVRAEE